MTTTTEVAHYALLARHMASVPWIEIVHAGKPLDLAAIEKQVILAAITVSDGDQYKAAQLLGMGKTTLYRRLKQYRENGA